MSWFNLLKEEENDDWYWNRRPRYGRGMYRGIPQYPYTQRQEHKIKLIKIAKDHLDKFDEKERKYIESYIRNIKVLGRNRDETYNNKELVRKLEKRLKRKGLMVHYPYGRIKKRGDFY